MEKRAILAAVLMAGLLIVYQVLFFPSSQETPPPQDAKPPAQAQAPPREAPQPAPAAPVPTQPPGPPRERPRAPQRTVVVDAPLYHAVVSSEGGKLQEWTLKYRGGKPMVAVGEFGPTGLQVGTDQRPAEVVPMETPVDALMLDAGRPAADLPLRGRDGELRVTETYGFAANDFTIDARIRVENLAAVGTHTVDGTWMGVGSTWYLVAFVPKAGGFRLTAAGEAKPDDPKAGETGKVTIGVRATPTIAPGQAWEGRVLIYIGPKEVRRLEAHGLEGALNFGGFPVPRKWGGLPMEWLGLPILKFMNWVYRYVGNYGFASILITILSTVLFYPLTVKSMRSMKAMQALQPQVNALRSTYKGDPQRLQRETLELYRKFKVNPMGGCLPMVAQVPIFYALYLALSVSVELQNAPFLCFGHLFGVDLWVCDLASHDPTYILPILMGLSMFVQQKMTPVMGDPRQAKAMLIMPFVFTFMFLNLPSGLVLYWFVSNVLQVLQQKLMDRPTSGAARETKDAARA